jgi:exosome complex component RRP46
MTLSSTILASKNHGSSNSIIENPTLLEIQQATSVHVLAFASLGDLLVNESEGEFTMDEWEHIYKKAQHICCGTEPAANADRMVDEDEDENNGKMAGFLRAILQEKVITDVHWKK